MGATVLISRGHSAAGRIHGALSKFTSEAGEPAEQTWQSYVPSDR